MVRFDPWLCPAIKGQIVTLSISYSHRVALGGTCHMVTSARFRQRGVPPELRALYGRGNGGVFGCRKLPRLIGYARIITYHTYLSYLPITPTHHLS